jgi:hypothetical protein
MHGAFQTNRDVTFFGKHLEVAPRSAAKIEYGERRLTLNMVQQGLNILGDVVIAGAYPEFFGKLIVVLKREMGDFFRSCGCSFIFTLLAETVCLAFAVWDQR